MKLELKEHELERVIEVYLQLQFNKEVHVNGFDLSGMRSKEGLSAMVDFTLVGESDAREPKETSTNVNPTNTSWREKQEEPKPKQPELEGKDLEDWTMFLELLTNNANYRNYDALIILVNSMSESLQQRASVHPLYTEMLENTGKTLTHVEEPKTEEIPIPEPEVEHVEAIKLENETVSEPEEEKPKNLFSSLTTKPSNTGNSTPPIRKLFNPPKFK